MGNRRIKFSTEKKMAKSGEGLTLLNKQNLPKGSPLKKFVKNIFPRIQYDVLGMSYMIYYGHLYIT